MRDGAALVFVPRFPFVDGTRYAVVVDGTQCGVLERPLASGDRVAQVIDIWPSSRVVPRNLLRIYIEFSERMSEGYAADCVHLVDNRGVPLIAALLPTEHELWDAARRRLTVLLDPARIKRGLAGHRELGYPLRYGESISAVVDESFRDAMGRPLRSVAERRYVVGEDERRRVEPLRWTIKAPRVSTREPIDVQFDKPLDHALLMNCLHVIDERGEFVDGRATIGFGEASWHFTPDRSWTEGIHHLVVDSRLEDIAGNSACRVFDRDLNLDADDPIEGSRIEVLFSPRGSRGV
jgi:hypothetical protein